VRKLLHTLVRRYKLEASKMGGLDGIEYQCNHCNASLSFEERDASFQERDALQKSVLDVDG